jgi:transcriptional regulator with XRE-family HTH domain
VDQRILRNTQAARYTGPRLPRALQHGSLQPMSSAKRPRLKRTARTVEAVAEGFGERLAALRSAAALTQRELAARLGVSRRQIAYYESGAGRPPGALLGLLADLFQVSTDALLGRAVAADAAGRLSRVALGHLKRIERMGVDACRRLETTLERFVAEEGRRDARRPPPATRRRKTATRRR